ncbi:plexin-A2-like [Planococcus citri]|uniref:plexin-A2-like n=1 Tax=Planococcus citri TaxID=170843 RepID=UPI0031F76307
MKFLNKILLSWVVFVQCSELKRVESLSGNDSSNIDFKGFADYFTKHKRNQLVMHRDTGIVYMSANNRLYQLSPNLGIQSNISDDFSENGIQADDYNEFLLIDYWNSRLMSCRHFIHQLDCITYSTQHTISKSNRTKIKLRKLLAYSMEKSNQTKVAFITEQSLLVTTKNEILGFSTVHLDDKNYFRLYTNSYHRYITDCVYGFAKQTYFYFFVILDLASPQMNQKSQVSLLKRLCSRSSCLTPVIKTECGSGNEQHYNLVKTAHAGKPGLQLARSLNITSNDDVLLAIFSKSNDMKTYSNGLGDHSALCVYSLNRINEKILEEKQCDQKNISHALEKCVVTSPPAMVFNTSLTAIHAVESGKYTEVFVGTHDGHIKIIIVENASMAYEQVDITIEEGSPVNSDLLLSPNKEHLYVLTGSTLSKIKIPRFNCSMLTNYDDCIKSNNITHRCGWCIFTGKCTIKHYCDQKSYSTWIETDFREKVALRTVGPAYSKYGLPQKIHLESLTNDLDDIILAQADFHCKISFTNIEFQSIIVPASIAQEEILVFTCDISEFSESLISYHTSMAKLSLQTAIIQHIWDQNITFSGCYTYLSEKECIFSTYPCYWCSKKEECTHYNEKKQATCPNGNIIEIFAFSPQHGPREGGTEVTILGQNLDVLFNNTNHSITVAGRSCKLVYKNTYVSMKKIECVIEQSTLFHIQSGPIEVYVNENLWVKSQQNFTFENPEIYSIYPNKGPIYGGTELAIKGKYLDIGRYIVISIGTTLCEIFSIHLHEIKCITDSYSLESFNEHTNFTVDVPIKVKFDNNTCNPSINNTFKYTKDLERDYKGFNLAPKGILSGGVEILIHNENLMQIQQLSFHVHNNGQIFNSSCKIRNDSTQTPIWSCISPPISNINSDLIDARNPGRMKFSLESNGTHDMTISMPTNHSSVFLLYPDPEFYHFLKSHIPMDEKNFMIIEGEHINRACQKTDITVLVGNNTCKVNSVSSQQVVCLLQKSQQESYNDGFGEELDLLKKHEYITVMIGKHFKRIVPKQKENSKEHESNNLLFIVICCVALLCLIFVVSLLLIYYFLHHGVKSCQAARDEIEHSSSRAIKQIEQQMNKMCMETIALKQCVKQVIIEHQIEMDENAFNILKLPNITIVNSTSTADTPSDSKYQLWPIDHEWEFPRKNLSLENDLGQGEFGKVVQAKAVGILQKHIVSTVAVKMLKDDHSDSDMIDLVTEMEIMKLIGSHDNVLKLLGCCTQDGELFVITEFARHGNLHDFLRNNAPSSGDKFATSNLSKETLLGFAQQISKGMEHLALKKCIHRDLAARNVLVFHNYTLKVADFGLARDIRNKEYYRKETKGRLPLKWMAPEALIHGLYSTQSDVWSYGILLWEIYTSGGIPYPTVLQMEELFQALRSGYRMGKPPNCCDQMYSLMLKCWKYMPEDRPTFTTIVQYIENIDESTCSQQGDITVSECKQ